MRHLTDMMNNGAREMIATFRKAFRELYKRTRTMNGSDIRKLRNDADLTQQELADLLHVTRQTIIKWEQLTEVLHVNEIAIRSVLRELIDFKFEEE